MENEKFLNVSVDMNEKLVSMNDISTMEEKNNYIQKCIDDRKKVNEEYINQKCIAEIKDQMNKLSENEFVLTNRFLVHLSGGDITLEPYEIVAYHEVSKDYIHLTVRLTTENVATVLSMAEQDITYDVTVKFLNPIGETIHDIQYSGLKLTFFRSPVFEYEVSKTATVDMSFSLKQ